MQRSIWTRSIMAAGVSLLLIAAFGYFSVSYIRLRAWQIVNDALPGIAYSGAAKASLLEAYENTLLSLSTTNADRRALYRKAMEESLVETTRNLDAYQTTIFDDKDRSLFEVLKTKREKYIEYRNRAVAVFDAGQREEALDLFWKSVQPAYKEYHQAGDALFKFNIAEGKAKGENIMRACTVTQIMVAVVGMGLFLLGFLLGLFR